MRTSKPLLGAGVALGVAILLVQSGEEEQGRVELNRHPPQVPRWGLAWDLGTLPEPKVGAVPAEIAASSAGEAQDDGIPADPGIWATPAEFAETD